MPTDGSIPAEREKLMMWDEEERARAASLPSQEELRCGAQLPVLIERGTGSQSIHGNRREARVSGQGCKQVESCWELIASQETVSVISVKWETRSSPENKRERSIGVLRKEEKVWNDWKCINFYGWNVFICVGWQAVRAWDISKLPFLGIRGVSVSRVWFPYRCPSSNPESCWVGMGFRTVNGYLTEN